MMNKKHIISFLFALFVFFSTNVVGNSIDDNQTHDKQSSTKESISQNSRSKDNHNIVSIEGIIPLLIKVNESNNPTFQNFNGSKKSAFANSLLQSFLFSKAYYVYYCTNRINKIKISPFYIVYHRLTI